MDPNRSAGGWPLAYRGSELRHRAIESLELGTQPFSGFLEIETRLQSHPEMLGRSEIMRQSNCGIGSNCPLS
jgi:hypothetical protein